MAQEPKRIERMGSSGLRVVWADGHESLFTWISLRVSCPCAVCREGPLPLAQKAHPLEIQPVGRYAMMIRWNDGHTTGIFSYDFLRSLCACEECRPNQLMEG